MVRRDADAASRRQKRLHRPANTATEYRASRTNERVFCGPEGAFNQPRSFSMASSTNPNVSPRRARLSRAWPQAPPQPPPGPVGVAKRRPR